MPINRRFLRDLSQKVSQACVSSVVSALGQYTSLWYHSHMAMWHVTKKEGPSKDQEEGWSSKVQDMNILTLVVVQGTTPFFTITPVDCSF